MALHVNHVQKEDFCFNNSVVKSCKHIIVVNAASENDVHQVKKANKLERISKIHKIGELCLIALQGLIECRLDPYEVLYYQIHSNLCIPLATSLSYDQYKYRPRAMLG